MNKIIIKGRLTKDIEIKDVNDTKVASFTVAVNRRYAKDQTDFFDCQAWRNTAEFISKYFTKGQEILIEGEMQQRKWQDKDGNNRYSWNLNVENVEFCGSKNSLASEINNVLEVADDGDLPF